MCWWASAGSCAVSVSYPPAALKPSEVAKAISGCPKDVVRYAAACPGPSTPVVVRSICEARVAPMSAPSPHTHAEPRGVEGTVFDEGEDGRAVFGGLLGDGDGA